MLRTIAATCAVGLFAAAPAAADQMTIDDPADIRTCWIASDGTTDYGGGCSIGVVGQAGTIEYRTLLHFDLSSVPHDVSGISAELRIPPGSSSPSSSACGRDLVLRKQNADWLGGTPTWTSYDGGTTAWAGGESTWSGWEYHEVDCEDGTAIFDVSVALGDWIGGNWSDNYGFEITGPDTAIGVSDAYSDPLQLTIDYTP